jgi:hypothetical protein
MSENTLPELLLNVRFGSKAASAKRGFLRSKQTFNRKKSKPSA